MDLILIDVASGETIRSTTHSGRLDEVANIVERIIADVAREAPAAFRKTGLCERGPRVPVGKPVIGVIPFSLDEGIENRALGDRIAHSLTRDLVRSDRFFVVERAKLDAVLKELRLQASGAVDPRTTVEIGRLLGASWLAYGHVHKAKGNQLRIDARVVRIETGEIRKAASHEGPADVFFGRDHRLVGDLLAQLGLESGKALRVTVENIRAKRREEANIYIKKADKVADWWNGLSEDNKLGKSLKATELEKAIFVDPSFAEAYFSLAKTYKTLGQIDRARAVLHSEIARHPSLILHKKDQAMGYFWLGTMSDCQDSIGYYKRAMEVADLGYLNNNMRLFMARCHEGMGQLKEAIAIREGQIAEGQIDGAARLAYLYERLDRFDDAIKTYEKVTTQHETVGHDHDAGGYMYTARRLELLRQIVGRNLEPMKLYVKAETFGGSKEGIDILNQVMEKYPRHPVAEEALALLIHWYSDNKRHGRMPMADYRKVMREIITEFPNSRYNSKAIAFYLFGADMEDHAFLIDNLPEGHIQRPLSLYKWGRNEYFIRKNDKKAKELFERFMIESTPFKDDPDMGKKIVQVQEHLKEIGSPFRFSGKWATIRWFQGGVKSARKGNYSSAGMSFLNGGQDLEGNWAWQRDHARAENHLRYARTFECLQIWTATVDEYQAIIDQHLYKDTGVAKSAQRRLDAILRDHPLDNQARSESKKRAEILGQFHARFEETLKEPETVKPLQREYFKAADIQRDGHRHCSGRSSPVELMEDPATSVLAAVSLLRRLIGDPDPDVRAEVAEALVPLVEKARKGQGDIGGVGMQLEREMYKPGQHVVVTRILEGMPAQAAGIQAGDILLKVDNDAAAELVTSDIIARIRGSVGKPVRLKFRRPGTGKAENYVLVRDTLIKFKNREQVEKFLETAATSADARVQKEAKKALRELRGG